STPTTAEIIYNGMNLNSVYKATIDLTNKTATTKPLITDLSSLVSALQPIFKRESHEYLSSLGSVIR
ncbi:MAG: hypothetical protein KKC26_05335, partial [Nanoarchaeota archaeon]|nr:hypothetical protein [Nanoarchaeota archaeon]MBU1850589.1 hypothetical protein [Nanoarchaeota archaeon]